MSSRTIAFVSGMPAPGAWRVVVVGDLVVDVVLAPSGALVPGTDVPGRVTLRAGGSAANTARWLSRLGTRVTLVGAVGRDPAGRALLSVIRAAGVLPRVAVRPGRTGRIGVLVSPGGERSFVADRAAADLLRPEDLRPAWFRRTALLHLPVYSLLGEPLGRAGLEAVRLAREAGALISLDLASTGPLLAQGAERGRALVRSVMPDLLFATAAEAAALMERDPAAAGPPGMLEPWIDALVGPSGLAVVAVLKRGARGVTVSGAASPDQAISHVDVPVRRIHAADTTAAGDAFDAGFIAAWLAGQAAGQRGTALFRRAARGGHRAARRQLLGRPRELPLL